MIILDLFNLFKTNPNSTKVPKIVFDWVTEQEKQFSEIEFKITFWEYKSEEDKKLALKYERVYGPTVLDLRDISFPLSDGYWAVKLIGDQRITINASGLAEMLKEKEPRIQLIPSENERVSLRGYIRLTPISSKDEEMVDIRCDRNVNDEWSFRGTGQEFLDEKVKPLLN